MAALICGSLAYDTIMVFPDQFKNHILPDKVHILNVSFLVPRMRREFGGCAGNIAYNLHLLGGHPIPMGTVGTDFGPYREHFDALGIDLSYENYFSDEGYFSVAYFWKDLNEWIFDGKYQVDLAGVADPSTGQVPPSSRATGSGKVNGGGGTLQGLELSATVPLNTLSEVLDGFGVVASYTVVDQDIKDQNGNKFELPGLSKTIQSYTVFYENNGFQARVTPAPKLIFGFAKGLILGKAPIGSQRPRHWWRSSPRHPQLPTHRSRLHLRRPPPPALPQPCAMAPHPTI